jgi:hypothetical protein
MATRFFYVNFSNHQLAFQVKRSATKTKTRGVSHHGLAIHIKKYLKIKTKNYGNLNISPCKNIIFKKSSRENQILEDINIL